MTAGSTGGYPFWCEATAQLRRPLVFAGTAAALTALVSCSSSSEEAVGGTTECTEGVGGADALITEALFEAACLTI